jgi:hypothetical protein
VTTVMTDDQMTHLRVLKLKVTVLGYRLTRPSDAQVVTGFELVTRT